MNQIGQPITDLFIGGKPLKLMSLLGSQKKVTLVKIKEHSSEHQQHHSTT